MSKSIASLEPETRTRAEDWLANLRAEGIPYTVTSTRRSTAEQRRLYERFLRGESRFPAARPGTSSHESGEALDVVFESNEELHRAVELAEDSGLVWAGQRDIVHFELGDIVEPSESETLATVDEALSLIPIVGTVMDVAEFLCVKTGICQR